MLLASRRKQPRLILATGALAAAVVFLAPSDAWTRLGRLTKTRSAAELQNADPEGSAKERYQIWQVAAKIIRDQPMLGVGLGAYPNAHAAYARDDEFGAFGAGVKRERDAHSTYLRIFAETGAPGLLFFLAMLLSTTWKAEQIRRACRVSLPRQSKQLLYLEFGLAGYLVAGIFGSLAYQAFLYIHLVLIWAVAEVCRQESLQPAGAPVTRHVPRPQRAVSAGDRVHGLSR
jgi:O-antigen ligase